MAETLRDAHERFAEAQMRLPRPEEYEPLVAPLREFARVSPALVEALREVVQAARLLAGLVEPLTAVAARARATNGNEQALRLMETASEAVRGALRELPRDADYGRVAAQLRELASVSPSLMEWLREVPTVATPLAGSVAALRRAVADLEAARQLLVER